MARENEFTQVCAILFIVLLFVFYIGMIGYRMAEEIYTDHWRTEAVKHGAAQWDVAPDGRTTFKWMNEPKAELTPSPPSQK